MQKKRRGAVRKTCICAEKMCCSDTNAEKREKSQKNVHMCRKIGTNFRSSGKRFQCDREKLEKHGNKQKNES